ncbi:hypothetical protein Dda_2667 [Drechslerella dactyloides]|uniref:MYND-type zinc finger protein samB n=1 Tax=Drechslerella dactyloides TaxID=74499 RepID=A0AAD6IZX1_DREDA|nr:hypothetical protein Dda_2667 [Drechslerella dactyloides]
MREVNFSIPNVNKASVGITTALYDRRALDCTSTLPLINSLNHLAYLTTSSARIRDILTVDGGVERLVCILKEGRSKDLMNMWKWNLAFQCVVNIGVRGSEDVRKRVVEADMVPVIATILDNYIQVMERYRIRNETNVKRSLGAGHGHSHNTAPSLRPREARAASSSYFERTTDRSTVSGSTERAARRQPPPPSIEIPVPFPNALPHDHATLNSDSSVPLTAPTITADRPLRPHHHRSVSELRYHANFPQITSIAPSAANQSFVGTGNASQVADMSETFGFRPVRDADRLPSMLFGVQGTASQPESPTTPNPLTSLSVGTTRLPRSNNRPSIRHSRSMSDESDEIEGNTDEVSSNTSGGVESGNEPIVDIQSGVISIRSADPLVESDDAPMSMESQSGADGPEAETFNITHRSPIDGSIMDPANNANEAPGFSQLINRTNPSPMTIQPPTQLSGFVVNSPSQQIVLPSMPREDDVLMSLQLLAYVSKYTYLRSYFQKSHLVPNLSINSEIHLLDEADGKTPARAPEPPIEEYLVPDDFNIFPLVEKFTVRHHPQDMQYWAGVVMRNLCRKDDSRGGIRQCAYFQCGKWEEFTRQFAKCRRCRRTKYCSKDCQKNAWVYHRHWCVVAAQQ